MFFIQIHASMDTPLHLASRNNHIEIASILISAGAKLDIKDMDGKVVLHDYRITEKPMLYIIRYHEM